MGHWDAPRTRAQDATGSRAADRPGLHGMGWSGWIPSSLLRERQRSTSPGWSRWASSRRAPGLPVPFLPDNGLIAPRPGHQLSKGTQFIHRLSSVRGAVVGRLGGIKEFSLALIVDGRAGGRQRAQEKPVPQEITGGEWSRPRGACPRTGIRWKRRESESSGADSASCMKDEQRWTRLTRSTAPQHWFPRIVRGT